MGFVWEIMVVCTLIIDDYRLLDDYGLLVA